MLHISTKNFSFVSLLFAIATFRARYLVIARCESVLCLVITFVMIPQSFCGASLE
jgi:hypothetical protein